jgi:CHRD domain/PEP-CTERM motif
MTRLVGLVAVAAALAVLTPPCRAGIIVYVANLNGPSESPPNASPGTGFAEVGYDTTAHTLHVHVTFSGLLGTTTASHIHSATAAPGIGTAGVATTVPTFPGFPLGVTSGTYDNTLDLTLLSSYNPAFVTANGGTATSAETALALGMASGEAYLNIHTTVVPGGEIRGFLQPAATIPEPSTLGLLALGGIALAGWRRRRGREPVTA